MVKAEKATLKEKRLIEKKEKKEVICRFVIKRRKQITLRKAIELAIVAGLMTKDQQKNGNMKYFLYIYEGTYLLVDKNLVKKEV